METAFVNIVEQHKWTEAFKVDTGAKAKEQDLNAMKVKPLKVYNG